MESEDEGLFDDPEERRAYEAFCEAQEAAGKPFELGEPAIVCRWRMAHRRVPLLNRHMRALSARRVQGAPLGTGLLSWAKQHVEWSVAEGAYAAPDGVLMLVVDVEGNAAMTVGEYEPLADRTRSALAARAAAAQCEAASTGVAPELLCAAADGRLLLGAPADQCLCGTATLVEQLAKTCGFAVARTAELPAAEFPTAGALFLVSDEHGVVPASDAAGTAADAAMVEFFASGYAKLFS